MADLSRWAAYIVTGVSTIGALHKADQIYDWAQRKVRRVREWWEKPPELAPPEPEPEYTPIIEGPEMTPTTEFVVQPTMTEPTGIPTGALAPSAQYTAQQLNDLMPRSKRNGQAGPHFPTDTREYDRTGKERRDVLGLDYANVVPGMAVQYIRMGDLVRSPQVPNDVGRVMDVRRGEFLVLWMSREDPEWTPASDVYRVEGQYN